MASAPYSPFTVSGTLKDVDQSTVVSGQRVEVYNYTKATTVSALTNSLGQFIIDLANASTGWDINDIIICSSQSYGKKFAVMAKIGATDMNWNVGTGYLHGGCENAVNTDGFITAFQVDNNVATARCVWIIEKSNNSGTAMVNILMSLSVGANAQANYPVGKLGQAFRSGFYVIYGAQSATVNPSTIAAGVANALGLDTTAGLYTVNVVVR